ncbi:RNA polymerase sigma factor [Cecembia calidifontis]|jgi:RNA polymerase sigma-70 factor (ECF subfamily)|uniref:RNA polymerase sigma-70 factor (ECF subfamily) n=1 Tax=Cecembia calidifontis TaxID=1187080 RepID=A0A4Q7P508_9BACT|nr:RNA polymerase sigma factor [Cecembia calidifontis]RZS95103.1 RNA polymerase sigma-70 factor (ECF subfamily) [Cecembia calidifontis]
MTINPKKPSSPASLSLKYSEVIRIYGEKSDIEIWEAFDHGDELAFNYLYRTFVPILFRYGIQLAKEEALVQDSIQNIFIYLRSKRGSLSKVNSIKAYLIKSLNRELLNKISKSKRVEYKDIDDLKDSFLIDVSCESKMIEFESSKETKKKLEVALNQLTPKQRLAILLLYEEGLNYQQIAEILEFKEVKSARKLVYRALNNLKSILINKH